MTNFALGPTNQFFPESYTAGEGTVVSDGQIIQSNPWTRVDLDTFTLVDNSGGQYITASQDTSTGWITASLNTNPRLHLVNGSPVLFKEISATAADVYSYHQLEWWVEMDTANTAATPEMVIGFGISGSPSGSTADTSWYGFARGAGANPQGYYQTGTENTRSGAVFTGANPCTYATISHHIQGTASRVGLVTGMNSSGAPIGGATTGESSTVTGTFNIFAWLGNNVATVGNNGVRFRAWYRLWSKTSSQAEYT